MIINSEKNTKMEKLELHYISNSDIYVQKVKPNVKVKGTVIFYVSFEWM